MNTNRNQPCCSGSANPYRSTQDNRRTGTYNRMYQNMYSSTGQRTASSNCSCNQSDPCGIAGTNRVDQFPVGMAYVPWQEFKDLYNPHQGLAHGTLFKELDYPFYGKRGNCR